MKALEDQHAMAVRDALSRLTTAKEGLSKSHEERVGALQAELTAAQKEARSGSKRAAEQFRGAPGRGWSGRC